MTETEKAVLHAKQELLKEILEGETGLCIDRKKVESRLTSLMTQV